MRFLALRYRPVVSAEDAERVGELVDVVFRSEGGGLVGLVVSGSSFGGLLSRRVLVTTEHLVAIGDDAITITSKQDLLPYVAGAERHTHRLSQVLGRFSVTRSGRLLGPIEDAEIDVARRLIDYLICHAPEPERGEPPAVEITNYLRVGRNLVVVPDEAVRSRWSIPFEYLGAPLASTAESTATGDPSAA